MPTSSSSDDNLALFCDFENVALGVRDAKLPSFDMRLVLERLLLKGNIVVKKAYCDWERYKEFKATMHETAFELIDIPHTRMSGKNSADIRMVVDALDLCYTKDHIHTFVIISGDSDFSPLVSKLRENAKLVVGLGVRNSTAELLMNNCDEFIFYDDLVAASDSSRSRRRRSSKKSVERKATDRKAETGKKKADNTDDPAAADPGDEAIELVLDTAEGLLAERGDRLWGSMVKQTLKRRRPGFSESAYGFNSFSKLLETARERGLIELEMDERSGGYVLLAVHRGE